MLFKKNKKFFKSFMSVLFIFTHVKPISFSTFALNGDLNNNIFVKSEENVGTENFYDGVENKGGVANTTYGKTTDFNYPKDLVDICYKSSKLATKKIIFGEYSTQYDDYNDPYKFANFRAFDLAGCKKDIIFAGASPWYKKNGRPLVISEIAKKKNVGFEINLECDAAGLSYKGHPHINFKDIEENLSDNYFLKLRNEKKYIAVAMPTDRYSEDYGKSIVKALKGLLNYWDNNGQGKPVYVHCTEGRFRTGDFLTLLYFLMGADFSCALEKFLISANNYFSSIVDNKSSDYAEILYREIIAFTRFLSKVEESVNGYLNFTILTGNNASRVNFIEKYLIKHGMTSEEIEKLKNYLKN